MILKGCIIVLFSSICGIGQSLFEDTNTLFRSKNLVKLEEITLETARQAFAQQSAIFIDARPLSAYVKGHIPGAISFPVSEFEKRASEVLPTLALDAPIIAYCSGVSCKSSTTLAQYLLEMGYIDVRIFVGGWPAWQEMGQPITPGESP